MSNIITKIIASFSALAAIAFLASCSQKPATITSATPQQETTWVIPNEGRVFIYIPRDAQKHEILAATELARVVGEMSGHECVIRHEPYARTPEGIYIGDTLLARKTFPQIVAKPAPVEEYIARAPFDPLPTRVRGPLQPERWDNIGWASDGEHVVIAGSDDQATRIAVMRFLQKEGNVRWWVPGPVGEDIPTRSEWKIAKGIHTENPSFYSRYLYDVQGQYASGWLTHNMQREHTAMNHSLPGYLTKDMAKKHPDWFPRINGKPFNVEGWNNQIPHPLFTNPELAEFMAGKAIEFFQESPDKLMFSVSPADHTIFGDLDNYTGLVNPNGVFRAKSDFSNAVFTLDNAIARRVANAYPDRYLGALAYAFWENAPDFPVEPNIIPILTADRSQWFDDDFKNEDLALIRKWAAAGPRILGTWDYPFGFPYLVPRVQIKISTESIPLIHEAGIRTYFAQLSPLWGFDAPKSWFFAQLLWDCNQDVEKLKAEFFDGYFGAASPQMREFFEECDRIWMAQSGKAYWLKYYGNADQIVIFPPESIQHLRSIINAAQALDLSEKIKARVNLVSEAFSYTERLEKAWTAHQRVAKWTPEMPVEDLLKALPAYLAGRADMKRLKIVCGDRENLNGNSYCLDYLDDDNPLEGRLNLVWPKLTPSQRETFAAEAPDYTANIARRSVPLFKAPFEKGLDLWQVSHWPNPLLQYTLTGEGKDQTLSVSHAHTFCLSMNAKVREGVVYSASLGASGRVSPGAAVRLLLKYLDKDGKTIAFHSDRLPCGDLNHALISVAGKAPANTVKANLTITVYYQDPDDVVTLEPLLTR